MKIRTWVFMKKCRPNKCSKNRQEKNFDFLFNSSSNTRSKYNIINIECLTIKKAESVRPWESCFESSV